MRIGAPSLVVLLVHVLLLPFHVRPLGNLMRLFAGGAGLVGLLFGVFQGTLDRGSFFAIIFLWLRYVGSIGRRKSSARNSGAKKVP